MQDFRAGIEVADFAREVHALPNAGEDFVQCFFPVVTVRQGPHIDQVFIDLFHEGFLLAHAHREIYQLLAFEFQFVQQFFLVSLHAHFQGREGLLRRVDLLFAVPDHLSAAVVAALFAHVQIEGGRHRDKTQEDQRGKHHAQAIGDEETQDRRHEGGRCTLEDVLPADHGILHGHAHAHQSRDQERIGRQYRRYEADTPDSAPGEYSKADRHGKQDGQRALRAEVGVALGYARAHQEEDARGGYGDGEGFRPFSQQLAREESDKLSQVPRRCHRKKEGAQDATGQQALVNDDEVSSRTRRVSEQHLRNEGRQQAAQYRRRHPAEDDSARKGHVHAAFGHELVAEKGPSQRIGNGGEAMDGGRDDNRSGGSQGNDCDGMKVQRDAPVCQGFSRQHAQHQDGQGCDGQDRDHDLDRPPLIGTGSAYDSGEGRILQLHQRKNRCHQCED